MTPSSHTPRLGSVVDGSAVLLSALCLLHCLALPLLVALLPLAASSFVSDERFHRWMLLAVAPSSALALGSGWRQHWRWRPLLAGATAVGLMAFAAWGGAGYYGRQGETVLTLIGAITLAAAHIANVWLVHRHDSHRRAADSIMGASDG